MIAWPELPLIEVARLIRGSEPGSVTYTDALRGVPFLRVGDITGKTDNPVYSDSSDLVLVSEEDVLLVLDGSPGHVSIGRRGAISSGIRKVEPITNKVSRAWLRYSLMSPAVQHTISRHTTGMTILHASSAVPYIIIFVPPLPEQERIVRTLDEADALSKLRAQVDRRMRDFIPALFHEMFGDPASNPKGWALVELGEVCTEIYRYPTFYGFEYTKVGVSVARIGNIHPNGFLDPDPSHYAFIDSVTNQKFPRTILELYDIVMAVRGDGSTGKRIGLVGSSNLVGANISPNLLRFKADTKMIEPIYLFFLMISIGGQFLVDRCITRTAKKTITAKDIKNIRIPLPPLSDQYEFVARVAEARFLEQAQAYTQPRLDDLFQSLLHRAFQGEL